MPAKITADIVAPPFAELLQCFPCPARIVSSSGKILARNTSPPRPHSTTRRTKADVIPRAPLRVVIFHLPPAHGAKKLRLFAHFPAAQAAHWQHDIISALLAKILQPSHPAANDKARLTPREREIYAKLSLGYSYKNISTDIGISHEAVRQHIVRMRHKLGDAHIPMLRQRKRKTPSLKIT